jgi:hypothetical protein
VYEEVRRTMKFEIYTYPNILNTKICKYTKQEVRRCTKKINKYIIYLLSYCKKGEKKNPKNEEKEEK